ncbi:hypothetical protein PIB30_093733 [Stylosanthes scabra]|uniref:Putative plant transposon protein domain-containing protein n=1 Tax=Stylosanthes scabra TaxID=79078 RepID=A0ABU6XUA9_9FABA|nr:hypothetical protein [Stylosanthes scabra]
MASSSNASRKRRGKAVVIDEEFDAYRFKTAFHQQFHNSYVASKDIIPDTKFNLEEGEFLEIQQQIELRRWKRLAKPKLKVSQSIIREFYANARINEDSDEDQPYFQTFVRGEVVNFNMESIKVVLRLDEQLDSDTSFRRRMIPANQELENVIQDLCVQGSTWVLGARNNPLYLRRRDLRPLARDLHTTRHPLAFPNVIGRLCEGAKVDYRAPNSMEAVPKIRPITVAVMENIREYQKLQQEQFQQLQAEQAQFHQEFTTYVNDFSTLMDKVHTELEAEKERTSKLEGLVVGLSLDTRANDTYAHWGLQQCVPNLVPTNPSSIPHRIRYNY